MKLNKYNIGGGSSAISSGYSSSSNSSSSNSLDRSLWGNDDTGEDIEETLFVNGSMYLYKEDFSEEEDDDDNDKEYTPPTYNPRSDDEGGNLYAEGEIEAPEMYATKTLYIPHPDTKVKTDIIELFKDWDDRIANNTNNIQINAGDILELRDLINSLETGGDLTEMQKEIETLKYGDASNPVILVSGSFTRGTSGYTFSGVRKDRIPSISATYTNGLLALVPTVSGGYTINILSCVVSLEQSGSTSSGSSVTSIDGRSYGAHWFETFWTSTRIYIREFHNGNANNDSWATDSWSDSSGVNKINVIITGYITSN